VRANLVLWLEGIDVKEPRECEDLLLTHGQLLIHAERPLVYWNTPRAQPMSQSLNSSSSTREPSIVTDDVPPALAPPPKRLPL